jgi:hypothetical protein
MRRSFRLVAGSRARRVIDRGHEGDRKEKSWLSQGREDLTRRALRERIDAGPFLRPENRWQHGRSRRRQRQLRATRSGARTMTTHWTGVRRHRRGVIRLHRRVCGRTNNDVAAAVGSRRGERPIAGEQPQEGRRQQACASLKNPHTDSVLLPAMSKRESEQRQRVGRTRPELRTRLPAPMAGRKQKKPLRAIFL